ncbi:YqaJ viral recombinase family protein [Saxibacter everestensis]|uniref:YqaJ viral recombinase family protein n=1 Tax=Saxibacter everestensis TaxID=2909229 RepID=A0ABY8QUM0_9MICO|nr:YqaJ viral recombinase family protein [Brevibacteriaceae bacterium ZFBP1038]
MSFFEFVCPFSDRDAWLAARRKGLTATDVARLASGGAGVWAAVRAEKAGQETFTGNVYTAHGQAREPIIAKHVEAVWNVPPNDQLVRMVERPEFLATPDGIGDRAIAEIKTTKTDWPAEDIPRKYIDQVQWQLMVTGKDQCVFAWEPHENFIPTVMEPRVVLIGRDGTRMAELVEVAERFLAQESETSEWDDLIAEYATKKDIADTATADLDEVKARIRGRIGDRDELKAATAFGLITFTKVKGRDTFNTSAFKKDHPDTYQEYVRPGKPSERLSITPKEVA